MDVNVRYVKTSKRQMLGSFQEPSSRPGLNSCSYLKVEKVVFDCNLPRRTVAPEIVIRHTALWASLAVCFLLANCAAVLAAYWPPRRRSTKCKVDSFWML
jgi:hypothetical protein